MKVLVSGASGFIGSHLCEALVKKGCDVRAFVRYNSVNSWGWLESSPILPEIEIVSGDVRNYDSVVKAVEGVDVIFHLAALIGIPYSYTSPDSYVDTNIKGTLNMLQAARTFGVKRFVHTSTSEVYGSAQFVPISEAHPINPQSPYAASKASADALALSFYHSFGVPVSVVRPFNTFGPRQSARAVIPAIITQLLTGKPEIKLGSLHPTRDLAFVSDTVNGFIRASVSKKSVGEVINLGTGRDISIGDLAKLIIKIMGVKASIVSDKSRKRPKRSEVECLRSDNGKAKKLLNWKPDFSLEEGLKKTISWLENNHKSYKADIYNV